MAVEENAPEAALPRGDARSPADGRAIQRISAYAPPVIPHEIYDSPCLDCHSGLNGVPAIPHKAFPNCRQCHVPRTTDSAFRENTLAAAREPRSARRAYPGAPPVMPHRRFMREHCLACHGPQARPDIKKTPHPERAHCVQCHVEQAWETALFKKNGNVPDSRAKP
jgi:cytochrome c-type protein NapB